jgi:hypothetical protein
VISVKEKKCNTWKKRQQFFRFESKIVFGPHRTRMKIALKSLCGSTIVRIFLPNPPQYSLENLGAITQQPDEVTFLLPPLGC